TATSGARPCEGGVDLDLTRDTPAPGVVVWQPRRGYRYGVEVYALAHFALASPAASAIDLGCGSGVVALLLASRGVRVRAIDREPRWVELARRSAADSELPVTVELADVRTVTGAHDLAVANPPWFPPGEPVSPDPWKATARAMLHGDVGDFAAAGLRVAPRVCLVTRRERLPDLPTPARIARVGEKLVLVELRRDAAPTVEEDLDLAVAYRRFGR
ncbi:MAG: methyltransferase domain-containing protein, partial [Myxococcota bacterium]